MDPSSAQNLFLFTGFLGGNEALNSLYVYSLNSLYMLSHYMWAMQLSCFLMAPQHPQYVKTGSSFFQGQLDLFRWSSQRVQISQTLTPSSGMLLSDLTSPSTSCAGDLWVPHLSSFVHQEYFIWLFLVSERSGWHNSSKLELLIQCLFPVEVNS